MLYLLNFYRISRVYLISHAAIFAAIILLIVFQNKKPALIRQARFIHLEFPCI